MSSSLQSRNDIEKKKRYLFLGVESLGVILTFSLSPLIGVPLIAAGAYLGWKWFDFRAKNGMRF
jgi:hypothetical protein